jgi:hypothetical protein
MKKPQFCLVSYVNEVNVYLREATGKAEYRQGMINGLAAILKAANKYHVRMLLEHELPEGQKVDETRIEFIL